MKSLLSNVLGDSPLELQYKHSIKLGESAACLLDLCLSRRNIVDIEIDIKTIVSEAYQINKNLRKILNDDLFLAIKRRDIVKIIALQNKLINKIKSVINLFIGRKMTKIEEWTSFWDNLFADINTSVDLIITLNKNIEHILEAGFYSRMHNIILDTVNQLEEIEERVDVYLFNMRQSLFSIEKTLNAIDVCFYYKFLDDLGDITNLAAFIGLEVLSLG